MSGFLHFFFSQDRLFLSPFPIFSSSQKEVELCYYGGEKEIKAVMETECDSLDRAEWFLFLTNFR